MDKAEAIQILSRLPLGGAVAVASPWVMALYGADYAPASPLLVVVAATAAVAATQNMLGNALAVLDRMWLNLLANLAWAVTNLLAAWWLLGRGQAALALCFAALAAYAVKLAITLAAIAVQLGERRHGSR